MLFRPSSRAGSHNSPALTRSRARLAAAAACVIACLAYGAVRALSARARHASAPPSHPLAGRFPHDPFALSGAAWGLNAIVFSAALTPPAAAEPLRAAHTAWTRAANEALTGTGAVIYDFSSLHVTASTIVRASAEGLAEFSREERAELEAAWVSALSARDCPRWPRAPFPLVFVRPRFPGTGPTAGGSAAYYEVEDPTGGVAAIRACLAAARESHAAVTAPSVRALMTRGGSSKTPSIVHATVMRFSGERASDMTDAEVESRWATAVAAWPGPVTVLTDAAALVRGNEVVVFGATQEEGADAQGVAWVGPYGGEAGPRPPKRGGA